jgi:hypothetical protein
LKIELVKHRAIVRLGRMELVDTLWPTLVQFMLRLSFGLALAMSLTPSRWVTSGFYRVHLWVVMGLATFTSLAVYTYWNSYAAAGISPAILFTLAIGLAVSSYIGAIVWMYEQSKLGLTFLYTTAGFAVAAGLWSMTWPALPWLKGLHALNWCSSGIAMGLLLAAMFLGHWYLNWPGMKLEPLKRLVLFGATALGGRALLAILALALAFSTAESLAGWSTITWSLWTFRWLAGIIGPSIMCYMTWQILKIPNTQSATGVLYAAVILVFLGELTSQLLSRALPLPV